MSAAAPSPVPPAAPACDGHAVVYAHYAGDGETPRYVWIALQRFLSLAEHVVFVAAGQEQVMLPEALADRVHCICRPNQGWDFASYRAGIEALQGREVTMLTLCNDSVYGPLFPLMPVYAAMAERSVDAWGMTASDELAWHLQSYFLCFGERALGSTAFADFWAQSGVFQDRREAIRKGEVELTRRLLADGLRLAPFCEAGPRAGTGRADSRLRRALASLGRRWREADFYRDVFAWLRGETRMGSNPSLEQWPSLLRDQGLPFVKRRVLVGEENFREFLTAAEARSGGLDREMLAALVAERESAAA